LNPLVPPINPYLTTDLPAAPTDTPQVPLSQINRILNQSRPNYDDEKVVCANKPGRECCPAYCCSLESTVHELSQPMDM
jgi:hypothetical protein